MDITKDSFKACLENFWLARAEEEVDEELKKFTDELVAGTSGNLGEIDKKISLYAANWQLERMAVIDRNIMRMGCYEIIFREDIPPKVSINEAVELAKNIPGSKPGNLLTRYWTK